MRSKVRKEADKDALRLRQATFREGSPVDLFGMAERLGIQLCETGLDHDALGALIMKPGADPGIVLNQRHSYLRRRLACALEMGHYVRMSTTTDEYKRIDKRDGFEEVGGRSNDEYAREFAGSLLMPKEDIKILADLEMDDLEMSLRFLVPREAMRNRLASLGVCEAA
jgi:Zn-dependent peptidase ImmA (M78 family)